ncbi:putative C6 transcription factor [Talaromyces proteolyticus]|uniref:C6 transcription factor n=1 Tax=Talaromyces proteolyticus TaxID=1131652 RepID=A0AAD4KU43_9EURO|nr:putative C6 transcription factor [Talaromyces proteolyticus]KAH8698830.1 putative C6 transcription factor [Talaromyces proteolyticus]
MRQRARYACVPCRQRKRKCDGQFPCSTCTGYGYECQYSGGNSNNTRGTQEPSATVLPKSLSQKRKPSAAGLDDLSTPSPASLKTNRSSSSKRGFGDEVSSLKEDRPAANGFLLPLKGRFIGRHSLVAFPQWVGMALQSATPPRVHSFAYNTGVRRELSYSVIFDLPGYITWAEVQDAIKIYGSVIHPIFGFLDIDNLLRRCHGHWHSKHQGSYFEALICGVIGLASLFSKLLCENRELRIIQHARELLDDPDTGRFPTLDTISAWILRTIYTRSTSRPGVTWLYSCTTMHLCESIGAYTEPETSVENAGKQQQQTLAQARDTRARIAIVARCLHVFISYEHGRSTVEMGPIPEHNVITRQGDLTLQFNALINALPPDSGSHDAFSRRQELCIALTKLLATPTSHEFFTLLRTDLCLAIYRRLRLLDLGIKHEQLEQVLQAGKAALAAARILVLRNHPWWNTVGTVFQFICVLLAIDNSDGLAAMTEAMETLETIAKHLQTHLAEEALSTARMLVRAMTEKKRREVGALENMAAASSSERIADIAAPDVSTTINTAGSESGLSLPVANADLATDAAVIQQWNGMVDFTDPLWNWDAFFEPPMVTLVTPPPFGDPSLQWG